MALFKKFKNVKLAHRISIYLTVLVLLDMIILWALVQGKVGELVHENILNHMTDAVSSRGEIIDNYVESAEEYLTAFALSDEVKNLLKNPDNKEYLKRAQEYTENFADVKGVFEGLYIADNNTYVYTHISKGAIGIICREGDSLKEFQKDILSEKKLTNTGIMKSPSTGNLVISMYYPVYENDKCLGYVGAAVYADKLMDSLLELEIKGLSESEYVFLNADTGIYLYNKNSDLLNTKTTEQGYLDIINSVKTGGNDKIGSYVFTDGNGNKALTVYKYLENRNWIFMIKDSYDNVFSEVTITRAVVGIVCIIIGLSIIAFILIILRRVGKELTDVENSIIKLGNIQLDADKDLKSYISRGDEIGKISNAVSMLCNTLKNASDDIGRILGEMANENLAVDVAVNKHYYIGDFEVLAENLEMIKSKLTRVMSDISTAAQQVNSGSGQVAMGAQTLSQGAVEQTVAIDDLAQNLDLIETQVRSNSDSCSEARQLMNKTSAYVDEVNEKINNLTYAMNNINESSKKISNIIKTIEDIAFQTNILALNAAVEAATAGEAGKGFAVVAEEVGNLAAKSAEAVSNTTVLIERSVEAVKQGSEITDQTAKAMKSLDEYTLSAKHIVDEIAESSAKQFEMVSKINVEVDQISGVVQANSATAEESAATSEELSGQAGLLKELIGRFTLK